MPRAGPPTRTRSSGAPAPGTVLAAPVDGGWTACQVIAHGEGGAFVAALDWFGAAVPTLAELTPPRVLVMTHHMWNGTQQAVWVGTEAPPRSWVVLGTLPTADVAERESYSGWSTLPLGARTQWWWDHVVPPEAREHYTACRASRGARVEVCGGRAAIRRDATTARIGPGKEIDHRLDERVDWASLRALGCLSTVEYEGTDGGVLDFVRSAPIVRKLAWAEHGRSVIDARGLGLVELMIRPGGPLALDVDHLPDLAVLGDGASLEVRVAAGHRPPALRLVGPGRPRLPIAGLDELRDLTLASFATVDLAGVAAHRRLEQLTIRGAATLLLDDLPALSGLEHLAELAIHGAYALTARSLERLEAPASLRHVEIHGYRKEEEPAIRRAFAGVAELVLSGGKKAAWVEANLDNPFLDWVDDHATEGRKAAKTWATAAAALARASTDDERWSALEQMVAAFQAIADRGKLDVDTLRREQIADAFFALARRAGLSEAVAGERFDAWRDF